MVESTQGFEGFQDPKIVLTINIINEMQGISDLLNWGHIYSGAKKLCLLILRLDIADDEKEMHNIRSNFTFKTYNSFSAEQIVKFYETVNDFLNRTYYVDKRRAKPKFGTSGKL